VARRVEKGYERRTRKRNSEYSGDKQEMPEARSGDIYISSGMRYRPELCRGGVEMKEKRAEEG
jgi:hypothetical protein